MVFPLPDELIGLTFDYLDVPSLLRCMQVCKLFHQLVLGNTQLVYKTELFASGMEDNDRSSMDTAHRLELLRKHSRAWNYAEWASSGTIPMSNGRCWEFSGGVLAQSSETNEVFFVQLPCTLKGIPEERWTVQFDFNIRDFALDNSQDLIVLLELVGTHPAMLCKLHLRTLSGNVHPRAAVAQITHAVVGLHPNFSFVIQICGGHLAVHYHDESGLTSLGSFFVWNWHTGHRKAFIDVPAFRSFAFMSEDLVLAAILRSSEEPTPSLQVLSIAALGEATYSLENMPYICELQYPELRGNMESFLIRSDPTPTWRPPFDPEVPFYASREDFIFTISIRVLVDAETHDSTVLFVPLSTLLSEVERSRDMPRRNVVWDDWGPAGTRMIYREPSDTWVCYTYGMKFIQGLRWKRGHAARIYDFNPYATRRYAKTSLDASIPWKRLAARSTLSSRCLCFEDEVTTTLPGRVASITLAPANSDEGWEAPMIGEDHILMVQPLSSTYGYMSV